MTSTSPRIAEPLRRAWDRYPITTPLSRLRNLPCEDFVRNQARLQLVLIAQDRHAWAQALCFDGALAVAEPKKLRHRVWHAAAVIARTGHQTIVRFQRSWPWTTDMVTAFQRLRGALAG